MDILLKAESELTEDESSQIGEVCRLAFAGEPEPTPAEGQTGESAASEAEVVWTEHEDWHVMVKVDGQVASRLGIVDRAATVGGQPVRLGGIGGVATHPDHRRKGYAARAMETAADWMRDSMGVDFGLLVCDRSMVNYYSCLGWRVVATSLWIEQPRGHVLFDAITMILPCAKTQWPDGVIDLCGYPW